MTVEPTGTDKYGADTHPAFVMIGASRGSSNPGAVLFDSDLKHSQTIKIRIQTASRKRDLNRDWIHPEKHLIEIEMSEAQWASFVSAMNTTGVPATLRWHNGERVPDVPYQPRLAESMEEVRTSAWRAFKGIQDAMQEYLDTPSTPVKPKRAALDKLQARIRNADKNVDFASRSLTEHAENVVQKARADIEATAMNKLQQLGALEAAPMADDILSIEGEQA